MMWQHSTAVVVIAIASILPVQNMQAHGYKTKSIEISHPWTFEQEGKKVDAVIGMQLKNNGKVADALLRVETEAAESAELRDDGKAVSRIELRPNTVLTLNDKGPHVFLKAVRTTLFPYNNLNITLVFARAGRIKVEVVVEDRPQ